MKADRMTADQVLQDIADYVIDYKVVSEEALNTARNCLMDTIGSVSYTHLTLPTICSV